MSAESTGMQHYDPISMAYLAGLFDGEGSFVVTKRGPIGRHRTPEYRPILQLANTHIDTMKEVHSQYGGNLHITAPDKIPKATKSQARIQWSEGAMPLVQKLYPHLRIKKRQALLWLQFIFYVRSIREERDRLGHVCKLRESDIQIRERFHQNMKLLNR